MKIKTKYSIGDVVIIVSDDNLVPAEITEIEFHKASYFEELKYRIMILNNKPYDVEKWVMESNICCKYSTRNAKRLMLKCLLRVTSEPEKKLEDGAK